MNLTVKHLDAELIAYINESENLFERRARMIAVKLNAVGAIQREELDYGTVLAKRTIGEYNRTKGQADGTYTEEMYVYATPFKTAFTYITENRNHFWTYFKYLVDNYGEENVEIHRMDENYSAESVVALLKVDHQSVHRVQYVTYQPLLNGLLKTKFKSKADLAKAFKLNVETLQKALESMHFEYEGQSVVLKIIPASVEVDFLKDQERTENLIQSFERTKAKELDKKEQRALAKQIAKLQQELKQIQHLLKTDDQHNQRVAFLKGADIEMLWLQTALNLKANYVKQKDAIIKFLDIDLIDLFELRIIKFSDFSSITEDITRIENVIKDLKRFEYEVAEDCILIKSKEVVTS